MKQKDNFTKHKVYVPKPSPTEQQFRIRQEYLSSSVWQNKALHHAITPDSGRKLYAWAVKE